VTEAAGAVAGGGLVRASPLVVAAAPALAMPRAPSAFAVTDEQGAAAIIGIGLGERQRFLHASPGTPQDHDPDAERAPVGTVHRRRA
jgi:hypothetical protein